MTDEAMDNEETKAPAEPARMCKGQMPSPLVWYIRFHEEGTMSEIAKKYFTTPGKITDIKKANNQKYIVENMTWSEEELKAAREQVEANFVRGQDEDAPHKRRLATTQAGDEEYSLEVLDLIEGMDLEGVSITDARAEYNEANPRATRKSKDKDDEPVDAEPADDGDDEELDDLLDD